MEVGGAGAGEIDLFKVGDGVWMGFDDDVVGGAVGLEFGVDLFGFIDMVVIRVS